MAELSADTLYGSFEEISKRRADQTALIYLGQNSNLRTVQLYGTPG